MHTAHNYAEPPKNILQSQAGNNRSLASNGFTITCSQDKSEVSGKWFTVSMSNQQQCYTKGDLGFFFIHFIKVKNFKLGMITILSTACLLFVKVVNLVFLQEGQ